MYASRALISGDEKKVVKFSHTADQERPFSVTCIPVSEDYAVPLSVKRPMEWELGLEVSVLWYDSITPSNGTASGSHSRGLST